MATDKTPERRLTDVLLDISEETFVKELEPPDYHRYSGLEEAVCGWARAAPLSCILSTQHKYRRPPNEAADNPEPSSVDPESSASIAEHRCGSQAGRRYTLKKSTPLEKHVDLLSDTVVAPLRLDAPERPVFSATQGEEGTLRETSLQRHHPSSKYSDNRLTKPHKNNPRHSNTMKNSHKPTNTLVPITNFTFFPPIKPPHLDAKIKGHSGKKAPEGEMFEEDWFMFGKKSDTSDEFHSYTAALTSIHRTCQHKPLLFSTLSVALPKTSCCMRPVK
ncbi:hypothetical protein JOB18_032202 [Solea senegalensis]|uniref:Uncharacterized protein n=1 Tax=Solea senegalensis TaxID=28829 RepID=A0AAV6Q3Z5_SOLSE|nr:uncharacterized protein LOC122771909 isoform X1 [Solea senegalensis]XP_043885409.1 uncharacterized protein LOC122771909 isoform X1 [Solea senegalensis]XP_043885410.1 uncharacterized protein LOC122771909 isoform X1 [Solea senegalensis]KAG7482848.1 hypothetical protein JOB18_032202 [Solea senegalensis]KAG7482849.1 hypothetical protein JOB18_032202 [Solea senegalensis]